MFSSNSFQLQAIASRRAHQKCWEDRQSAEHVDFHIQARGNIYSPSAWRQDHRKSPKRQCARSQALGQHLLLSKLLKNGALPWTFCSRVTHPPCKESTWYISVFFLDWPVDVQKNSNVCNATSQPHQLLTNPHVPRTVLMVLLAPGAAALKASSQEQLL